MHWLYLGIAILAEVIGTSALKTTEGFTKARPALLVIVGYAVSFYFLSLTLAVVPVGTAYAIWSGVGLVIISTVGWVWFHQKLDPPALIGISLIITGVMIINLFSKSTAH